MATTRVHVHHKGERKGIDVCLSTTTVGELRRKVLDAIPLALNPHLLWKGPRSCRLMHPVYARGGGGYMSLDMSLGNHPDGCDIIIDGEVRGSTQQALNLNDKGWVKSFKWTAWGPKPDPTKNYAGLVVYDLGAPESRSAWQGRGSTYGFNVYPGLCCIMELDDVAGWSHGKITEEDWAKAEEEGANRNQPHRPLCLKLFGVSFDVLQRDYKVVLGGFAIRAGVFTGNSGAFNIGDRNDEGWKDGKKEMTQLEAKCIAGAFRAQWQKGWPQTKMSLVTVDEAVAASAGMVYESKVFAGSKPGHKTCFIDDVFGLAQSMCSNEPPAAPCSLL